MPRCEICETEMHGRIEIMRGYCDICQTEVRKVFDKDAFSLGHSNKTNNPINNLDWTNYLDKPDWELD